MYRYLLVLAFLAIARATTLAQLPSTDLLHAEEPAITLFPFGQDQRAVVFANGNNLGVYDLVGGSFQLVSLGSAPNPNNFFPFDPVAVTQPDGG